jgi:hypothetical protein
MTTEQEKIAEQLIDTMKQNNGSIDWRNNFMNRLSIDKSQMSLVIKALRELEIIENFHGDTTVIRLTEKNGWTFPGFDALRHTTQSQKTLNEEKDKYDLLTKRFIYKARFIPFILSGLALIVSIFAYFKKPEKDKPATQSVQPLTQPATNTTPLLPVDTAQKTTPK